MITRRFSPEQMIFDGMRVDARIRERYVTVNYLPNKTINGRRGNTVDIREICHCYITFLPNKMIS